MVTATPKIVKQTFLKPGRYNVKGRFGILTKESLGEVVTNTRKLLANGWRPPVIVTHAKPGSRDGEPIPAELDPVSKVRNGAGRLVGIGQNEDGSVYHELEITDSDTQKKIEEKSIAYTSPELRPSYVDGKGNQYGPLVAHVALTHMPRNPDQGSIDPVVDGAAQFSLTSETSQFALEDLVGDDDEEGGGQSSSDEGASNGASDTPANPDMPAADNARQLQFQACLQLLQDIVGVSLPADATEETGWRDLLGCLKTLKQVKDQQAAEDAEKEAANQNPDTPNYTTDQPPMGAQFSLDDVEAGRVPNKLASRIIRQEHTSLVSRIEKLASATAITPALATSLKARAAISQFSLDDGDISAVPILTLPDLIGMLENGMPPGKLMGSPTATEAAQFSADGEQPIAVGAAPTVKSNGEIDRTAAQRIHESTRHLIPKELRREASASA